MNSDTPNAADEWVCNRKKAYPDEKFAKRVARRIRQERGANVVAYGCGRCGAWHIGREIAQ